MTRQGKTALRRGRTTGACAAAAARAAFFGLAPGHFPDAVTIPLPKLHRPPWPRHPDDRWIQVDGIAEAAAVVGRIARRAWLTIGSGGLAVFGGTTSVHFLVRLVEPPLRPLPLCRYQAITGRRRFTPAERSE